MSESQSNPSLYVSLSPSPFSPGAVKIKDCHAKWPDTRGQRRGAVGCIGRGQREGDGGVIVEARVRRCGSTKGGVGVIVPSQFIPYYGGAQPKAT